MKRTQIIIKSAVKLVFTAVVAVSIFSACKKDEEPELQEVNTIELSAPATVLPGTATVNVSGRILEFSTKHIAKIRYYYIPNSNEYTKRVVVESDFSRDVSKTYFGNILNVTVDGSKSDKSYAVPYNQYTLALTIPLAGYNLVEDEYVYVGVEVTTTDGSRFVNAKQIKVEVPEAE